MRRGLTKLHKASLLIDGLKLSLREAVYVATHAADFADFSFDSLPADESEVGAASFEGWRRVAQLAALSKRLPQRETTLIDVFDASSLPASDNPREKALSALIAASQWNEADLEFLVSPVGLNLAAPGDFRDTQKLANLDRALAISRRVKVSAERLRRWATPNPDQVTADDVVAAVQAVYGPDLWSEVGKPLRDFLREAQRDALVAYILNHDQAIRARGITNADGLFEHFLIDTQIGACMDTSRIKQAISSVQLFIQRALMNLEQGVDPDQIDSDQWHWMRSYRVWEANRKVFLFPENWIEPELRDDKSPFFRELESQLMQNDIDFDMAEAAIEQYLEKLHEVGRLDIRALYTEEAEDGGEEIVHLFGRTLTSPITYYYRKQIGGRSWTPWEKVDAGIEGDHLLPMVANRRLYLFWLHFEERQNTGPNGQTLPYAYIQSMEHWLWKTQAFPKWQADQKEWLRKHAFYATWTMLESVLRAASASPDIAAIKTAFFDENEKLPEQEEPAPTSPEEPPYSVPPVLNHREITLCWSEYRNGAWSAKQSSEQHVTSRHVAPTLQDSFADMGPSVLDTLNTLFGFVQTLASGEMVKTIFGVYLPAPEEHYLFSSVDRATGLAIINVWRRYKEKLPVLDLIDLTIRGNERVGAFEMSCGSAVKRSTGTNIALDYDMLPRPDATTNLAMSFQYSGTEDIDQLAFTRNGDQRVISRCRSEIRGVLVLPR